MPTFSLLSGQIGTLLSGSLASGNTVTYSRNVIDDTKLAGNAISGVTAVCLGSGGQYVLPAERQSGLRLPAFAVSGGIYVQPSTICTLALQSGTYLRSIWISGQAVQQFPVSGLGANVF